MKALDKTLNWRLVIAGISLAAAIAVYSLARIHPPALLAPLQLPQQALVAHGALFGSLPSFFYTLAVGLLVGTVASTPASAKLHCMLWLAISLVLELTQHPVVALPVAERLALFFPDSVWSLIGPYWMNGRFDPMDLLATITGAGLALLLLPVINREIDDETES